MGQIFLVVMLMESLAVLREYQDSTGRELKEEVRAEEEAVRRAIDNHRRHRPLPVRLLSESESLSCRPDRQFFSRQHDPAH